MMATLRQSKHVAVMCDNTCSVFDRVRLYTIEYNWGKVKGKVHPCTGTEALYRPYGPEGE